MPLKFSKHTRRPEICDLEFGSGVAHRVYRVSGFLACRLNWVPPPPLAPKIVLLLPPLGPKGGETLARIEGWGDLITTMGQTSEEKRVDEK